MLSPHLKFAAWLRYVVVAVDVAAEGNPATDRRSVAAVFCSSGNDRAFEEVALPGGIHWLVGSSECSSRVVPG